MNGLDQLQTKQYFKAFYPLPYILEGGGTGGTHQILMGMEIDSIRAYLLLK